MNVKWIHFKRTKLKQTNFTSRKYVSLSLKQSKCVMCIVHCTYFAKYRFCSLCCFRWYSTLYFGLWRVSTWNNYVLLLNSIVLWWTVVSCSWTLIDSLELQCFIFTFLSRSQWRDLDWFCSSTDESGTRTDRRAHAVEWCPDAMVVWVRRTYILLNVVWSNRPISSYALLWWCLSVCVAKKTLTQPPCNGYICREWAKQIWICLFVLFEIRNESKRYGPFCYTD